MIAGVDWLHNDNETYDIQEDENKEYINNNEIDLEEYELEDIDND